VATECPLFSNFSQKGTAVKDQIGHFIRGGAFGVLEEMRVNLKRDRRDGVPEAMLNFGDGAPPAIRAEAQLRRRVWKVTRLSPAQTINHSKNLVKNRPSVLLAKLDLQ
jgi:hypothetical protein